MLWATHFNLVAFVFEEAMQRPEACEALLKLDINEDDHVHLSESPQDTLRKRVGIQDALLDPLVCEKCHFQPTRLRNNSTHSFAK